MPPTADLLPRNWRVNMHAQRRAGWRGDTLARVVRCIREVMLGDFGGWLDPVPEHVLGYVLLRLPPFLIFFLSPTRRV
jgi:hypothetical protein